MHSDFVCRRARAGGAVIVVMAVVIVVVAILLVVMLTREKQCGRTACCPPSRSEVGKSACLRSQDQVIPVEDMSLEQLAAEAGLLDQEIQAARSAAVAGNAGIEELHRTVQRCQMAYVGYLNTLNGLNELADPREAARLKLTGLSKEQERLDAQLGKEPENAELQRQKSKTDEAVADATRVVHELNRKASEAKQAAMKNDPKAKELADRVSAASQAIRNAIDALPDVSGPLARKSAVNARRRELLAGASAASEDDGPRRK